MTRSIATDAIVGVKRDICAKVSVVKGNVGVLKCDCMRCPLICQNGRGKYAIFLESRFLVFSAKFLQNVNTRGVEKGMQGKQENNKKNHQQQWLKASSKSQRYIALHNKLITRRIMYLEYQIATVFWPYLISHSRIKKKGGKNQ